MSKKNILIFIAAYDFSEIEFLTIKNYFEKHSYRVFVSSDSNSVSIGEMGLKVKADVSIYNIHSSNFSAFLILGGKGIRKYWQNQNLISVIMKFYNSNKLIGGICGAPVCLAYAGVLKKATCFDSDRIYLEKLGVEYSDDNIILSENIITAKNQNYSKEFAEQIMFLINRT